VLLTNIFPTTELRFWNENSICNTIWYSAIANRSRHVAYFEWSLLTIIYVVHRD